MDKRFEIVISFDVKQNGQKYHSAVLTYHEMPYIGLLAMQKAIMAALADLGQQSLDAQKS